MTEKELLIESLQKDIDHEQGFHDFWLDLNRPDIIASCHRKLEMLHRQLNYYQSLDNPSAVSGRGLGT